MAGLKFENVSKQYPNGPMAVKDFNLEIEDKEFVIFVGPSGCGKSTTLRMIAGLEEITEGNLYIDGKLVNDVAPKDRDIAMVFQNYALYPHMTVYKNMGFALEMRQTPKDEIDKRVREAAKILDIEHLLERKPKALSGGQRQRVALGRAMVRNPAVFLLDEPLSNLDAKLRASMRTELTKLHKKLGTTFVYVTHDQTEAMTMGDRIVVINQGVVQQVDTPQNLYNDPCNIFVAGFIGSPQMNFLDAVLDEDSKGYFANVSGDKLYFPEGKADKEKFGPYIGKSVKLGVRPEDIYDDDAYVSAHPDSVIDVNIDVSEPMGSEVFLYLGYKDFSLTARVDPMTTSKAGDNLKVAINMSRSHLFDAETELAILN